MKQTWTSFCNPHENQEVPGHPGHPGHPGLAKAKDVVGVPSHLSRTSHGWSCSHRINDQMEMYGKVYHHTSIMVISIVWSYITSISMYGGILVMWICRNVINIPPIKFMPGKSTHQKMGIFMGDDLWHCYTNIISYIIPFFWWLVYIIYHCYIIYPSLDYTNININVPTCLSLGGPSEGPWRPNQWRWPGRCGAGCCTFPISKWFGKAFRQMVKKEEMYIYIYINIYIYIYHIYI